MLGLLDISFRGGSSLVLITSARRVVTASRAGSSATSSVASATLLCDALHSSLDELLQLLELVVTLIFLISRPLCIRGCGTTKALNHICSGRVQVRSLSHLDTTSNTNVTRIELQALVQAQGVHEASPAKLWDHLADGANSLCSLQTR